MSESSLLARRAGLVALGTLASRVLGLVRDAVVAAMFAVTATDAFYVAYTIPNTFRVLLGEGAISNAFVPVFTQVRSERGAEAGKQFLARFGGTLGVLLVGCTALGMLAAAPLATAYAGGMGDRLALVTTLTRVLFPFLALVGVAALLTGALNVLGRFTLPAFAPALQNVAVIAAPFAFLPLCAPLGLDPIFALVIGTLLGGLLQVLVQLPALGRAGMLPRPRLGFSDPDVRRALALMAPLLLGSGVYQLNIMLSRLFTSYLPRGAMSYLYYGARVIEIPQGMFALAIASAALPTLARLHAEGKREALLDLFRYALRLTFFIGLPATFGLWALAEPIAALLLGRGAFEPSHVVETGRSLAVQALGVWAVAAIRVVVPMFAAQQDTRSPVIASALNLVVFLGVSAALLRTLEHVGIAVANSVAAAAQLALLLWWLRRRTGPLGLAPVWRSAGRALLASSAMAVVARLLAAKFDWTRPASELTRFVAFAVVAALALVSFVATALILRAPELRELAEAVRRRRRRAT
ncbi:MAG: murein biosynthesis integral membrane protein MurJ [Polyangiales bacterium]